MPTRSRLKFVDLFAGIGGFHLALGRLGHECILACEIDPTLQDLYEKNFQLRPKGDIRMLTRDGRFPEHDILCAGFPCQPFSKAGEQQGFDCPTNGDLFDHVLKIVRLRKPRYVILENVPNLRRHNDGDTWLELVRRLKAAKYDVDAATLSPHQFGIPQIRERVFIVASRKGIKAAKSFEWPQAQSQAMLSIDSVLEPLAHEERPLPTAVIECLTAWQRFLDVFPADAELPGGFPFWSMEWGATYPFESCTPLSLNRSELSGYRGSHGQRLEGMTKAEMSAALPSYARGGRGRFPEWKIRFIRLNRQFYEKHREVIDGWLPSILPFPSSRQKLEWNVKDGERNIWQYVLQLRASGVRVKRRTTAPSLVAMTTTQVPIIAWERRFMTERECARLQNVEALVHLPAMSRAYKALGNAVNARVVELVARELIGSKVGSGQKGVDPDID